MINAEIPAQNCQILANTELKATILVENKWNTKEDEPIPENSLC